ncbi:MAG: penicillin-insensitive murein endopeptidase [Elusimicrobia bacterium]|nr:penicillin-insensitive murein endopeptidase [Elusimicrobiota bacterium]
MPRKLILAALLAAPAAAQVMPAAFFDGAATIRQRVVSLPHPSAFLPAPRRGAPLASLAVGAPNRGRLVNGAELPVEGPHWRAIRPEVGRLYGTSELVDGLRWTAERLRVADPATPPLAVGDLSGAEGGRAPRHRSHQNGRDADVNFFWLDAKGAPLFSERMTSFDAKGRGVYAGKPLRFDAARNWRLVTALLTNPHFGRQVRWIFVSRGLRALLLKEGAKQGAAPGLLERAGKTLAQPPGNSHRNHFHVRLACSGEDLKLGCKNL